jgi:hypothetical protein
MLLRAIQVYARNAMLLTAPSSIELRVAQYGQAALSIELRANYRITEKSIGLEGLSPPMALSLAIIWLTISANRSLNQASNRKRYRS